MGVSWIGQGSPSRTGCQAASARTRNSPSGIRFQSRSRHAPSSNKRFESRFNDCCKGSERFTTAKDFTSCPQSATAKRRKEPRMDTNERLFSYSLSSSHLSILTKTLVALKGRSEAPQEHRSILVLNVSLRPQTILLLSLVLARNR